MRVICPALVLAWFVFCAAVAGAQETAPGATPIAAPSATRADPTVVALEREKLAEEVEQLREGNAFDKWRWLAANGTNLLTGLAAVGAGSVAVFRYLSDKREAEAKRQSEAAEAEANRQEELEKRLADAAAERQQRTEERFRLGCVW